MDPAGLLHSRPQRRKEVKREIREGVEGKTLESVEILLGAADGSDNIDVRFADKTGLVIALKETAIEVESVELRDWSKGEGTLLKKFT